MGGWWLVQLNSNPIDKCSSQENSFALSCIFLCLFWLPWNRQLLSFNCVYPHCVVRANLMSEQELLWTFLGLPDRTEHMTHLFGNSSNQTFKRIWPWIEQSSNVDNFGEYSNSWLYLFLFPRLLGHRGQFCASIQNGTLSALQVAILLGAVSAMLCGAGRECHVVWKRRRKGRL